MNTTEIITAIVVLAIIALIIGIILSIAEKVFKVEVDEKEVAVRAELPGSNCGGCGFAGCDALAAAIAKGEAPVTGCPVGGKPVAEKIAEIMGQEVGEMERKVAYVKCDGFCENRETDYNYFGIDDCVYAAKMPGSSPYACKFGCLGYGSCVKVCDQNAIRIIDKKAVVDENLCIACGKCLKVCPHDLIELIPASSRYRSPEQATPKHAYGSSSGSPCGAIAAYPARKAKDEPRKAGTLPLDSRWNRSVPIPANSSVSLTEMPVRTGTSTVAPNIANRC